MSQLDHLLLRPQILVAQRPGSHEDIGALVIDTISRILRDLNHDRAIINRLVILVGEAMQEIWGQLQDGILTALQALKSMIDPVIEAIHALADAASEDFASSIEAILGLVIDQLVQLGDAFKVDALEAKLQAAAQHLDKALHLSDGGIYPLVRAFTDHVSDGLTHNYLNGDQSDPALERFIIGTNIRKIADFMGRFLDQQAFKLDLGFYITQLMNLLRQHAWDEKLDAAKSFVQSAGSGFKAVTNLTVTFGVKFNVDASVSDDPISWYGTWVSRQYFGYNMVSVADLSKIADEPWYKRTAFDKHTYEKMERVAHITHLVADYVESFVNTILIGWRPRATSIFNAIFQAAKASMTIGMRESTNQRWVDFYTYAGSNWVDNGFTLVTNYFLGFFETNYKVCSNGNCCITCLNLANNFGKFSLPANYTYLAREIVLSLMTLNNMKDQPADKDNGDHIFGLSNVLGDIATWVAAGFSGREGYGIQVDKSKIVGWWLLGAFSTMGLSSIALGIRKLVGGKDPDGHIITGVLVQNFVLGLLKFPVYWYCRWDGNTEDGKAFGFAGYGPKATSPYLLPYVSGLELHILQGNLGMISHNLLDSDTSFDQIYSWDFSHDFHDKVLAIRDGAVTSFIEGIQDGNHDDGGNEVNVQHIFSLLPAHDRGREGVVETTTAEYLHGAHMGVRQAFALYGVPANNIAGAFVRQGQLIMYAGDTGNSRLNHLHLNITSPSRSNGTVPMVFRDCDEDDGVPRNRGYYTSTNTERPYLVGERYPAYAPLKEIGTGTIASATTLTLQDNALNDDDVFNGCYILVTIGTAPNLQFEYKQVTDYDGGDKVVTVDSNWSVARVGNSVAYQIGIRNRASADAYEKNFAFWGMYNGTLGPAGSYDATQVGPFADGAPVYKYAKIGRYNTPPVTGAVISSTTSTVTIAALPPAIGATLANRFIVIQASAANPQTVVSYQQILSWTPGAGTDTITIAGTWGVPVTGANVFAIGNPNHTNSTPLQQHVNGAYWGLGPAGGPEQNFPAGGIPFDYLSFKFVW